jgi:hypothetical protein
MKNLKEELYLNTVNSHIRFVQEAGQVLMELDLPLEYSTIKFMSNLDKHDKSKYSKAEFKGYADYFFGEEGVPRTPEVINAFDLAWHHHYMNNPHHPEHWFMVDKSGITSPLEMPDIYIIEMLADWIGAGKSYGNPFETWVQSNIHKFGFAESTAKKVHECVKIILNAKI